MQEIRNVEDRAAVSGGTGAQAKYVTVDEVDQVDHFHPTV